MQLKLFKIYHSTLVIPLFFSSMLVAQQEGGNSLDEDDTSSNAYIESVLSELPTEPPAINVNHSTNKERLVKHREKAHSNLDPSLPKKESKEGLPLPEIERVNSRSRKKPEELYETLAKQTGLSKEQIEELFSNSQDSEKNSKELDKSNPDKKK